MGDVQPRPLPGEPASGALGRWAGRVGGEAPPPAAAGALRDDRRSHRHDGPPLGAVWADATATASRCTRATPPGCPRALGRRGCRGHRGHRRRGRPPRVVDGHLGADSPGQGDVVIRVRHVSLPAGLNALARRGPADELTVYVSDALPPDRQRTAVRIALRASRRAGWRALLPAPSIALLLASGMTWLRRAASALRA